MSNPGTPTFHTHHVNVHQLDTEAIQMLIQHPRGFFIDESITRVFTNFRTPEKSQNKGSPKPKAKIHTIQAQTRPESPESQMALSDSHLDA